MDWNSCQVQYATSDAFRAQWDIAAKTLAGTSPNWILSSFDAQKSIACLAEKTFTFIPEESFRDTFGVTSAELPENFSYDVIENERGQKMKGLLIADDPFYKVKVQALSSTVLSTHVQPSTAQLRPSQAEQVGQWYQSDVAKIWPAGLRKGRSKVEVSEALQAAKAEKRKAEEEIAEQQQQQRQADAVGNKPLELIVKEEAHEDDAAAIPELTLPSHLQSAGKGKGKGKANKDRKDKDKDKPPKSWGKRQNGEAASAAKQRRVSIAEPLATRSTSQDDRSLAAVSRARNLSPESRVSGATAAPSRPSASPWERLVENCEKYTNKLSIEDALSGKSNGHNPMHGLRCYNAMEATAPGSTMAIELRDKLDLIGVAESISVQNLHTKTKAEREAAMHEVLPRVISADIPMSWATALVKQIVREMVVDWKAAKPADVAVAAWLAIVMPPGDDGFLLLGVTTLTNPNSQMWGSFRFFLGNYKPPSFAMLL